MPLSHARIAVNDTTPVMVTEAGAESGLSCTIQIQNLGSTTVYVGGAGLTSTSYGCSIVAGGALTIDNLYTTDEVYALSSSGAGYVAVLKVNR
jgi:hypothetical protein